MICATKTRVNVKDKKEFQTLWNYINEQKATIIVDEIKHDITEEEPYSSEIFTAEKCVLHVDKALASVKHITPYVVVDSECLVNKKEKDKHEVHL